MQFYKSNSQYSHKPIELGNYPDSWRLLRELVLELSGETNLFLLYCTSITMNITFNLLNIEISSNL